MFDLLNSNTYVSKTVSTSGYTASRTNTLSRYAMLTFTWNLNKFPGSQQQKRMPGMFNNFRGGGGGGDGRLPVEVTDRLKKPTLISVKP